MSKPKIRFPQYADDWRPASLSSIATEINRKATIGSIAPVMMITAANGFIEQSQRYSTDNAGSSLVNYTLLRKGELAYNHGYSSLRHYGSCFDLKEDEARIPFVYHAFKVNVGNPEFWGHYLNCGIFDKQLRTMVASTARMDGLLNISFGTYTSLNIRIPTEDEQDKIAEYFNKYNTLIENAQLQIEKLKSLKICHLNRLFPIGGGKTPPMRLEGFTEEWKEAELGDCFDERQERSSEGELLSVTIGNGIMRFSELNRHDNSSADKSNYKVVCKGDIVYNSMRMWQGASGFSEYNGIVSPAYTVLIPREGINSKFFACLFKNPEMINKFRINSQGMTSDTWNLKYPAFSKIKIRFPKDPEEQLKIAEYFENLNEAIRLHEEELERLKSLKESCLQGMFV